MCRMGSIGVVTLPGRYNYGNRLQNYAIVRIYEKLGFKVETLELKNHQILRAIKKYILCAVGRQKTTHEELMSAKRLNAFDSFSRACHPRVVRRKAGNWKKEFDFFSAGSDQVWNPHIVRHMAGWYFLDFARMSQRIALSPSIGINELTGTQLKKLADGLKGFPRVSVREERGAEIIKGCSRVDVEVTCDPTLVLSAEEWRSVASDLLTPAPPYVFAYLLGGTGIEASEVLEKVTDCGNVPVIPLSDRQKPGEPDAGPAEFISLIDNATYVVTDSFHASVFASILQTPLVIVHREGDANMFSRLEQLSMILGINHMVYGSPEFDLSRVGDYSGVPEAIERERERFLRYLEGCLNE